MKRAALALAFELAACGTPAAVALDAGADATVAADGGIATTAPALLTPPVAGTHDEDPSLIRARDGSYFLAWLSDRDGNDDVYLMRSRDGATWDAPVRVTNHPDPDWYPHLVQTQDGRFHLVWFRAMTVQPFYRHLFHNSSDDGLAWDPQRETQVTDGVADDWAPTLLQTSDGDLLAYFSSQARGQTGNMELYLSRSHDLGATWQPPLALATANDPARMDMFPSVIERAPGDLAMVWVRYDTAAGMNYFDPSSDLYYAQSSDGAAWSQVAAITHDAFVDSVPSLYAGLDGARYLLWTSTGPSGAPKPKILDLALADRAAWPAAAIDATAAHGMNGYSAQAAATGTAGRYLGVWVDAEPKGSKRLYWQIFAR